MSVAPKAKSLMPVMQALELMVRDLSPLGAETVPVARAVGRVLASPLSARRSQPAADMSAMDGYAFAYPDPLTLPLHLTVMGDSSAGRPFAGPIAAGEAVRIFTGAVLPPGADTVVIQENVMREGAGISFSTPLPRGRNVRKAGFDFQAGAPLLPAGRRLNGRDVMLAAAADHAELEVVRRPRVGIVQTGDELVYPGRSTGAVSDVIVSNAYGIAALAGDAGAEVLDLGLVRDTMEETRAAIRRAADLRLDLLVSSGGASVGEHDLIAPALRAEGVELSVHKVALRPGKPLMHGIGPNLRVLGLPGNPVSAYVCAVIFLLPMLRALQGETGALLPTRPARLGAAMPANDSRMDFQRALLTWNVDGLPHAMPLPNQDSSMLSALAEADCLLIRREQAPPASPGDPCEIIPLNV